MAGGFGKAVPGAGGDAVVTAIDVVAHLFPQVMRDRSLVLDGQIGDAPPRIHAIGAKEGICGAGCQATRAGAAASAFGLGRAQIQRRVDFPQKKP